MIPIGVAHPLDFYFGGRMYCLNSWGSGDAFSLDIPDNAYTRAVLRPVRPPSFVVFLTHPEFGRLYYQVAVRADGESAPYSYGLTRVRSRARVFNDRDVWLRAETFRVHVGRALRAGDLPADLAIERGVSLAAWLAWFESATEWRERSSPPGTPNGALRRESKRFDPILATA